MGNNCAFINNDYPGVTDTITSAASLGTISADMQYTLTVAVGNPSAGDWSLYGAPGNVAISLLANGVAFATQEISNGTVPNGTFEDFSLTYTTSSSDQIIGEALTIQLASLPEEETAYKPAFDDVTLDATAVEAAPEPATLVLLLAGSAALLGFAWMRRAKRMSLARGFASLSVVALGIASASADPVDVPNASFEADGFVGWTYSNPNILSDWTFSAPAGTGYGSFWLIFFNSPGTSMGNEGAFIDNTSPGQQAFLTSAASLGTIAADTTYTLTVAIGDADLNDPSLETGPIVFDPIGDTPMADVSLTLLANGQPFATNLVPAGSVANGTFQDFCLTYTTTNADPLVGEALTIQLGATSNTDPSAAAVFDNVRLDATDNDIISGGGTDENGDPGSAPEPSSLGLLGLGLGTLGWLARWRRDTVL